MKSIIFLIGFFTLIAACESKPKVIVAEEADTESPANAPDESATQLHKVVVEDLLHTSKYTYLEVSEEGEKFWIAIPRTEVEKGGVYYYRGGLKKRNFKSAEHDRVFETIYLVSGVSKDPSLNGFHAGSTSMQTDNNPDDNKGGKIDPPPGGITIAELLANKKKYEGQTVRIKGRCVKLNNMIMNRNWVHLQDGSLKDDQTDLTITTTDKISLGDIVAFEGTISLNKDFGAGYKYEIIMEEAHVLQ